jgi:hypothetical protein
MVREPEPPHMQEARERTTVGLGGGGWARFRVATAFADPGIQYVDVALQAGSSIQRRRLFTNVERPPRVLAVGDDLWTKAFAPGALLVVRRHPAELTDPDDVDGFDGVVLDSVPAAAFTPEVLDRLAAVVAKKGAGLFLMNGRHLGTPRDSTNLMTYGDTPLDALLPLSSRPRPKDSEPPPRHVVIVIDSSSSMCGGPLTQARQIAEYIIQRFLRPVDRVDLLTFTTEAAAPLTGVAMTAEGKARAADELRRIACSGGTDPTRALQMLNARSLSNCALLFFSDGEFAPLATQRPDCRTTAFGINTGSFGPDAPIRALADPIEVPPGFDPTRIKIPAFEPRPIDQFFEPGGYPPLSMKFVLSEAAWFSVPPIRLEGSATTFLKPGADLIAVRPKLTDPVLAYRQSAAGVVGEFTTTLPPPWLAQEDGRRAIREWITAILPLVDSRRYVFRVTQEGMDLTSRLPCPRRKGTCQWSITCPRRWSCRGSAQCRCR